MMATAWAVISGAWRACWWAVTLPLQLLGGGGAPAAPGVEAYEAEVDAGSAEPAPAALAPAQHQAEPVKAVRRAAARRLAAMEEGRDPAADDRLPAWTSAWLSSLDARQLQTLIELPGPALADVLSGARCGPDREMEALQRIDTRPRVVPIADRMRGRMAARAVESMPEVGVALGM
ncbi:MAG: hypothetical protein DI601_00225 [Azospirillum brasilense]|nr:MAG: hypothetical protein DI601_00225 [Azospirillum brasilense]